MTIVTSTALHFVMVVNVTTLFIMMCLARQDNTQLHNYLEARNPKKDSTLNLNALLAKPIVVCYKYFTTQLFKHIMSLELIGQ